MVAKLNFMTPSISYGIVTLIIDGVTSFYHYLMFKNVRKDTRSSLKRAAGNVDSLFKMAESL